MNLAAALEAVQRTPVNDTSRDVADGSSLGDCTSRDVSPKISTTEAAWRESKGTPMLEIDEDGNPIEHGFGGNSNRLRDSDEDDSAFDGIEDLTSNSSEEEEEDQDAEMGYSDEEGGVDDDGDERMDADGHHGSTGHVMNFGGMSLGIPGPGLGEDVIRYNPYKTATSSQHVYSSYNPTSSYNNQPQSRGRDGHPSYDSLNQKQYTSTLPTVENNKKQQIRVVRGQKSRSMVRWFFH